MLLASLIAALTDAAAIEALMQQAFYPALLGILVIASLGIPIPEDIPLIAAGVLLRTHPGIASWPLTLLVAFVGIMSGDLVLYTLGRRWGNDVFSHRSVRWLITPERFAMAVEKFHERGAWFCFFGRFLMGVRAVMCITAGATRFPYWRFFLADAAGAVLSIPLFVGLGWAFAEMLPILQKYLALTQGGIVVVVGLALGAFIWYEVRKHRRRKAAEASKAAAHAVRPETPAPVTPAHSASAVPAAVTVKPDA